MARKTPTTGVIYQIRDTETGKVYVGSAKFYASRKTTHLHGLRRGKHHSILLQRAWDKRGESAFVFEVIEADVPLDGLVKREQYWMDQKRACDPACGYNVAPVAGSSLGVRHTPETCEKFSRAQRRLRAERPISDEARAKMSAAMRGNTNAAGRTLSAESREKMGRSQRGRKFSEEHKAKLRQAWKNRPPVSEQARRNMAEAGLARWRKVRELAEQGEAA